MQPEEVLKVGVFADLGDSFLIGDAKALFDDERAQRDAALFCRSAHAAGGEVGSVVFFDQMPGHDPREFDPAVLRVELAAKG